MVRNHKPLGLRHGLLALFDFGVVKLFHPPAIEAHHVVVVLSFIEFINCLATFEVVAAQDAGLLELGQHPVNRGQSNVGVVDQQLTEDIFGRHVPLPATLKNIQNFQARHRGFEPVAFEFFDLDHGVSGFLGEAAEFESCRYNDRIISVCLQT